MLEYRLEPEGGLLVCALGTLEVGGGQIVECSLCLSDILPERRVALAVERVAEDFFLPSPTGQGMPLTRGRPRRRADRGHPLLPARRRGTGGADSPVRRPLYRPG